MVHVGGTQNDDVAEVPVIPHRRSVLPLDREVPQGGKRVCPARKLPSLGALGGAPDCRDSPELVLPQLQGDLGVQRQVRQASQCPCLSRNRFRCVVLHERLLLGVPGEQVSWALIPHGASNVGTVLGHRLQRHHRELPGASGRQLAVPSLEHQGVSCAVRPPHRVANLRIARQLGEAQQGALLSLEVVLFLQNGILECFAQLRVVPHGFLQVGRLRQLLQSAHRLRTGGLRGNTLVVRLPHQSGANTLRVLPYVCSQRLRLRPIPDGRQCEGPDHLLILVPQHGNAHDHLLDLRVRPHLVGALDTWP
mmetsp:Transcript_47649/g.137122  ORF Transcript_47649/g.137122 Transcript_47649/m.137122 type:complete len:307 (+) Transcript_47649:1875-2795(+)